MHSLSDKKDIIKSALFEYWVLALGLTFLNGLLAFAVTMIVMSTVVAAIVEFIYTVRAKRQRYLRAYLLDFFDTQLLPNFEQKIVQIASAASERIRDSSTTPESNRLAGWVISLILVLRRPGNFWQWLTFGAIPLVFLSIALIYISVWTETLIVPAFVVILVYYCWDQHSQDSKLNQGIDKAISEKLGLSPEARKQLDSFRQNFVDEIAKQGTDPENGKDYAERITPTEFASALGRSELGQILVQTGRGKLNLLITDLLRRFDTTGAMSLVEFKRKSTRLSVIVAFITAFVVNINAITLLAAYFADDDLSARVVALYSEEELAGMAGTLNAVENKAYVELVQKQEKLNEKQEKLKEDTIKRDALSENTPERKSTEKTIKKLKEEIERLRSEINGTVATLTAIGTPVGWRYFPFCLPDASGRHPGVMPSCQGLSSYSALLAEVEAGYLPDNGKVEQAEETQLSNGICGSARNTANDKLAAGEGYFWIKPAVVVCDHWDTTWQWLNERKHNLFSWLMGVLLAGVLIGLGGPFWFDFYRRLATVTQIARSFGAAQPKQKKSQQDSSPPPKPDDPQTKHTPDSAVDAFEEAVEAKRIMTDVPAPRRLLNADGT